MDDLAVAVTKSFHHCETKGKDPCKSCRDKHAQLQERIITATSDGEAMDVDFSVPLLGQGGFGYVFATRDRQHVFKAAQRKGLRACFVETLLSNLVRDGPAKYKEYLLLPTTPLTRCSFPSHEPPYLLGALYPRCHGDAERLLHDRQLRGPELACLIAQLAQVLAELQRLYHLRHGDLKLENVLYTRYPEAVNVQVGGATFADVRYKFQLGDFGLAGGVFPKIGVVGCDYWVKTTSTPNRAYDMAYFVVRFLGTFSEDVPAFRDVANFLWSLTADLPILTQAIHIKRRAFDQDIYSYTQTQVNWEAVDEELDDLLNKFEVDDDRVEYIVAQQVADVTSLYPSNVLQALEALYCEHIANPTLYRGLFAAGGVDWASVFADFDDNIDHSNDSATSSNKSN